MEAMRINILLFFFASIFLFGCQREQDDRLAILTLQAACIDKWAEIEYITSRIEAVTIKGGQRKADLRVLDQSKRIANWKRTAVPELSVSGLESYANALIKWASNEKVRPESLFFNQKDPARFILRDIQNGLIKLPPKLATQTDSLHYFQILYLLLRQETNFQDILSARITDDWSYNSSTSKLKYSVNDTVKLISPIKFYGMNEGELLHFRVKNLRITHQDKPTNITPSVEIIGKYVILKFIVRQKGAYLVNGIITGTYPESKKEELAHTINQHITVE